MCLASDGAVTQGRSYGRAVRDVLEVALDNWSIELFEDDAGRRPVETWLDGLTDRQFAAVDAALTWVLKRQGIGLLGTRWLTHVGHGLYEFRIRHSSHQILRMYANAGEAAPARPGPILLRVFVTFHGRKVILLLHGYDKGSDDSKRRQQREIREAARRLKQWRADRRRKRGLTLCALTHTLAEGGQRDKEVRRVRRAAEEAALTGRPGGAASLPRCSRDGADAVRSAGATWLYPATVVGAVRSNPGGHQPDRARPSLSHHRDDDSTGGGAGR